LLERVWERRELNNSLLLSTFFFISNSKKNMKKGFSLTSPHPTLSSRRGLYSSIHHFYAE